MTEGQCRHNMLSSCYRDINLQFHYTSAGNSYLSFPQINHKIIIDLCSGSDIGSLYEV